MNRQPLLIAMTLMVAGSAMLYVYMQRFEQEVAGGSLISVVTATEDLPLGSSIRRNTLAIRAVPQKYIETRHIRASEVERIIGTKISTSVKANEALLWTDLATGQEHGRDLSSLVQSGMRAVTIPVDLGSSFSGLLRPGDRVDVLYTTQTEMGSKLVPLLQNILVLASGRDTGETNDKTTDAMLSNVVSLSVTLQQAQILAYAKDKGKLTLTLRNPDDIAVIENLPETDSNDFLEAQKRVSLLSKSKPTKGSTIEHVQ